MAALPRPLSPARTAAPADLGRLFDALPHTAAQHFALLFFAALLRLLARLVPQQASLDAVLSRFPCLAGYLAELADNGLQGQPLDQALQQWEAALSHWARAAPEALPLARLRDAAGLDEAHLVLLALAGLAEEDARLGEVLAALQGDAAAHQLGATLAASLWPAGGPFDPRAALQRWQRLGVLLPEPGAPGQPQHWRPDLALWPAVRGRAAAAGGGQAGLEALQSLPASALLALDALVLPGLLRQQAEALPGPLRSGALSGLVLRGPPGSGRQTLAGAIAQALGCGLLVWRQSTAQEAPPWARIATLACLQAALPVLETAPSAGQPPWLPPPDGLRGQPWAVLAAPAAALGAGPAADQVASLSLGIPDAASRALLWQRCLAGQAQPPDAQDLARLAARRLPAGTLVRAARRAGLGLQGDGHPSWPDRAYAALLALESPALATLARRVDAPAELDQLALPPSTRHDLHLLLARCRHREQLAGAGGSALAQLGTGVRALLKGPSGTGKTLAARALASRLALPLYRVDLASVVDKYIGETEKNLERVFAQAEAQDVLLLLDEGDALLAQRTGVGNANDRYANLETNFLLQRLEAYQGILLITTNAAERIDSAFQRRMDLVIDFPLPEAAERWALWQLHLPPGHAVDASRLQAIAQRCAFSGGQVRNVALHATLLALDAGAPLVAAQLEAAIEREYRKLGSASPLRGGGR